MSMESIPATLHVYGVYSPHPTCLWSLFPPPHMSMFMEPTEHFRSRWQVQDLRSWVTISACWTALTTSRCRDPAVATPTSISSTLRSAIVHITIRGHTGGGLTPRRHVSGYRWSDDRVYYRGRCAGGDQDSLDLRLVAARPGGWVFGERSAVRCTTVHSLPFSRCQNDVTFPGSVALWWALRNSEWRFPRRS